MLAFVRSRFRAPWFQQAGISVGLALLVFVACLVGIYSRMPGTLAAFWPANALLLGLLGWGVLDKGKKDVDLTLPSVSANIMVQADGAGVTCRITVDDVVKDERTSDGVNPQTYCLVKSA